MHIIMADFFEQWLTKAEEIAQNSADPDCKVGAVIVNNSNEILSIGYNNFPEAIDQCETIYSNKTRKLYRVLHAEIRAILDSTVSLKNSTIYVTPLHPCSQCAAAIIHSGIKRVVIKWNKSSGKTWAENFTESSKMLQEANVDVIIVEKE